MKKKNVLILGAGPAGLTAAYELLNNGEFNVTILEKENQIGGLCKTIKFKNTLMDYGVHFYRISEYKKVNDIVYNMLPITDEFSKELTEKERKNYIKKGVTKDNSDEVMLINSSCSNIYFDKKFYEYPIKINFDTIKKIGFLNLIKIGFSYLKVLIKKREEINLENYYINRYGKKFYEMFFLEYTKKICGVHPKDIDIDWGKQRIRETSFINILKEKIFKKRVQNEPSLIDEYYYPKYGCGQFYEKLAQNIINKKGKILTNSYVKKIKMSKNKITDVIYMENKEEKHIKPDYIISSIPLKEFPTLLEAENLNNQILDDIKNLPFRDLVLVNIILSKKDLEEKMNYNIVKNDSWFFIQDPNIKFGRIKISNNWSKYMLTNDDYENNILLTLEYCCDTQDNFYKLNQKEIIEIAKKELQIIDLYPKSGIKDYKIEKVKNAYPAYYGTYKKRNKIIKYLNEFENIYFIGRAGQHQYIDMDKAMMSAIKASENIIKNKKTKKDVWL